MHVFQKGKKTAVSFTWLHTKQPKKTSIHFCSQERGPSQDQKMNSSNSIPCLIGVAFKTLLQVASLQCKKEGNKLLTSDKPKKGCKNTKHFFLPGLLGFTLPKDDERKQPDQQCSQLEGHTRHLWCQELIISRVKLKCFKCKEGELLHQDHDFKAHGHETPTFSTAARLVKLIGLAA